LETPPPFALTPLTGRDTEFSLLKDRWEQAQEGMGQVLLVVGQPGLGKSRLVQTLTQRVQAQASDASLTAAGESASASFEQDSPVIEWRCSQHFQNSELHPVSDYLERFLGVGHDSSATGWRGIWRIMISAGRNSWRYLPSCYFCHRMSAIREPA
jgi:predicted ATPase